MNDLYFLEYFINSHHRIYWLYILSTLCIAGVYLLLNPQDKRINLSKRLWLHPSATLDYRYFMISFFIKVWLVIPIIIGANEIAIFTQTQLSDYFGLFLYKGLSYTEVMLLFTVSLFIVSDFTRYWLHRFMHTIPFLWKFHQVHHSAKVLTPITFYRVHPVENILFGFRFSLSYGIVTGVFIFLFGGLLSLMDVLGVNIIVFVFNLIGANLRHSHIKLKYFTWIEKIIISPFQHQIHHSTKFYNYNFGGSLAIWDLWFSTLKYSEEIKYMKLGLGTKKQFKSVLDLLLVRK
ncbi:MAG: sterol desaturase family protein, partial [Sulfurimonas sp.]|nr:sterol desaturase family protein [Sulfurimonas sp.]